MVEREILSSEKVHLTSLLFTGLVQPYLVHDNVLKEYYFSLVLLFFLNHRFLLLRYGGKVGYILQYWV